LLLPAGHGMLVAAGFNPMEAIARQAQRPPGTRRALERQARPAAHAP
jgi:hypothetical protein